MTVRIGVIGAGVMGTDHAIIGDGLVSGAAVVAVHDVDAARAADLATRLRGARATDDADELITADDVDAVIIAASDTTHAGLVRAAIVAGKPVLCEKPLAPTAAECREIVEAVRATPGAALSVGFMRRFDPGYVELRAALTGGVIGAPVLVHNQSRGVSAPGATSAGLITNSAIHELDIVPWLLDSPIAEISWHPTVSRDPELADPQLLLLRTRSGVLATVEAFLNARYGYDIRCEVVGAEGTRELVSGFASTVASNGRRSVELARDWRPRFAEAYRREQQAWVDGLRDGRPSDLATAEDGWAATRAAEAAIAAMADPGVWVEVEPAA